MLNDEGRPNGDEEDVEAEPEADVEDGKTPLPQSSSKDIRQLSQQEIELIEEVGEVSPPGSSLFNQVLLISAFAVLGAYMRVILTDATPTGFVNYLTSQFIGSFVLGLIFKLKPLIHTDLFTGVSVGFCGSLTTFSSWQLDIMETIVGVPGSPTSASGKAYAWFQDQTIGFAVPFAGLTFGKHAADLLIEWEVASALNKLRTTKTNRKERSWLIPSSVGVCTGATWLAMILGAIFTPGMVTFSLLLAPFGAWLRFVFSRYLNVLSVEFYWGTFAANILGSVIAGMMFDLLLYFALSPLGCAAMWAVIYGFTGSLTTVSTFVNEIHTLPQVRSAYVYGFFSVLLTQGLLLIIMGSYVWSTAGIYSDNSKCYFLK